MKDVNPGITIKETPDATEAIEFTEGTSKAIDDPNNPVAEIPDIDVSDAMEIALSYVGKGRYQKILFILMMPFGLFFACVYFVQMFIAAIPQKHWCKVPELAHLDMELRRNLSAPGAATGKWDKCSTFDVDWSKVLETRTPPPPDTPTIPCKHGWDFELTDIPYPTVVSERGWVCNKANNVPIAQAVFFLGSVAGCMFFGWMADRFGRVPALVGTNLVSAFGGIATIFTVGMWDFSACRFLVGMGYDNVFMMIYILVLEYVDHDQRTFVANMSVALFFGTGCVTLPWLAYFIRDWRRLSMATSIPMFLVIFAPLILPESARWYVSVGRTGDAVKVLKKFERINRTKIPDNVMNDFIVAAAHHIKTSKQEYLFDLMRSPPLRAVMIVMLCVYMSSALTYDGLVRLSDAFGLDFFITFTMTSATELPSAVLVTLFLDSLGRRFFTAAPLGLTGVMIIVTMFMPLGIMQAFMATMSRFFINMSFMAAIQWATELLPTTVRASGSSMLHMSGNVISILSPFIAYSECIWPSLPLLILCIVAFIAALLSTVLPETKNWPMPQTVADGEKLVADNNTWSLTLYRKSRTLLKGVASEVKKKPNTSRKQHLKEPKTPEDLEDTKNHKTKEHE